MTMLILYVFLTCFKLSQLKLYDGQENVCRNHEDPEELHCCYNHFEINDTCQECKNGTLSEDENRCQKCKNGWYGYRCLSRCNCSKDERCDNVNGCIPHKAIENDVTTDSSDAKTTLLNGKRGHSTDVSLSFISNTGKIKDLGVTTKQNTESPTNVILYYIFAIGVLIVILLACIVGVLILKCFRKKSQHPTSDTINDVSSSQLSDQIYQGIYDEIVDIPELETTRNSYLSIKSEKVTSEMNHSSVSINNGHSVTACRQTSSESFHQNYSFCIATDVSTTCEQTCDSDDKRRHTNSCVTGLNIDENSDYITPIA